MLALIMIGVILLGIRQMQHRAALDRSQTEMRILAEQRRAVGRGHRRQLGGAERPLRAIALGQRRRPHTRGTDGNPHAHINAHTYAHTRTA